MNNGPKLALKTVSLSGIGTHVLEHHTNTSAMKIYFSVVAGSSEALGWFRIKMNEMCRKFWPILQISYMYKFQIFS